MIIHLTGGDTYRSAKRLAELRAAFIAKHDRQGLNTVSLDGSTVDPAAVRAAITSTGFFSKRRFVSIDRYAPDGATSPAQLLELLSPFAAKDHELIIVVRDLLSEAPARAAKRLAKGRKPKTTAGRKSLQLPDAKREVFSEMDESEAMQWLQQLTRQVNGTIDPDAARRLIVLTNNDSWRMATELDKLLTYAAGRAVSVADVEAMVVSEYTSDIFALTDALGHRQTNNALALLHRELAAGTNSFALLATLANHVRNLWLIKRAQQRGQPAIATALGLHPYVVQKASAQTLFFEEQQLQRLHHRLLDIDHDLKTSRLDAETLLDLLLIRD